MTRRLRRRSKSRRAFNPKAIHRLTEITAARDDLEFLISESGRSSLTSIRLLAVARPTPGCIQSHQRGIMTGITKQERNKNGEKGSSQILPADPYMPPAYFQQLENLVPLVEDVGSSNNRELWLVQLPSNELGAKDLMEQQWNMQADDADCKLGHFYSSRGEMYDVVKQEMDSTKLFAIFPNSDSQFSVHRIAKQICFKKNIPKPSKIPPAGPTKKRKALKFSSLEDSSKSPLASERQTSTVSEASLGKEAEGRRVRKKKSRKEGSTIAV